MAGDSLLSPNRTSPQCSPKNGGFSTLELSIITLLALGSPCVYARVRGSNTVSPKWDKCYWSGRPHTGAFFCLPPEKTGGEEIGPCLFRRESASLRVSCEREERSLSQPPPRLQSECRRNLHNPIIENAHRRNWAAALELFNSRHPVEKRRDTEVVMWGRRHLPPCGGGGK